MADQLEGARTLPVKFKDMGDGSVAEVVTFMGTPAVVLNGVAAPTSDNRTSASMLPAAAMVWDEVDGAYQRVRDARRDGGGLAVGQNYSAVMAVSPTLIRPDTGHTGAQAPAYGDGMSKDWVAAKNGMLWNGSSFDLGRAAVNVGDASSGAGMPPAALYLYNASDGWSRGHDSYVAGDGLDGRGAAQVGPRLLNDSGTFDRARSADAASGSSSGSGIAAVNSLLRGGDNAYRRQRAAVCLGDNEIGHEQVPQSLMLYNGSTYDRMRGNTQGDLLAMAARTGVVFSPDQLNVNARGVQLLLYITVAGTGTLQVSVYTQGFFNAGFAPVTASGCFTMYPGLVASSSEVPHPLPRQWKASVTPSDGSSWTYELIYNTIV